MVMALYQVETSHPENFHYEGMCDCVVVRMYLCSLLCTATVNFSLIAIHVTSVCISLCR
jgi:hypothetical protein